MDTPVKQRLLRLGLVQIPMDGLVRLRQHIDAGRPMIVGAQEIVRRHGGRAVG